MAANTPAISHSSNWFTSAAGAGSLNQPVNLDKELQFQRSTLTKPAFAAQIVFITLVTVVLFTLFIMFFFFVIAAKVERKVVTTSVQELILDMSKSLKVVLSPNQVCEIAKLVSSITAPKAQDADAQVKAHNDKLKKQAFAVLGIAAGAVLIVVLAAYFGMRGAVRHKFPHLARPGVGYPDMKNVMLITTFGFAAVVLGEFVFLYTVAARYKPLDGYKVNKTIIDELIRIAKTPPST